MIANATFTPPHSLLGSSPSLMLLTQLHLAAESLLRRLFLAFATLFNVPQADWGSNPGYNQPSG